MAVGIQHSNSSLLYSYGKVLFGWITAITIVVTIQNTEIIYTLMSLTLL